MTINPIVAQYLDNQSIRQPYILNDIAWDNHVSNHAKFENLILNTQNNQHLNGKYCK